MIKWGWDRVGPGKSCTCAVVGPGIDIGLHRATESKLTRGACGGKDKVGAWQCHWYDINLSISGRRKSGSHLLEFPQVELLFTHFRMDRQA